MMTGPPIKIHIDPNVVPVAVSTPAQPPIHWLDEIKEQLYTDVRLGVIEKVEHNTPTPWLQFVEHSGLENRTVDLDELLTCKP